MEWEAIRTIVDIAALLASVGAFYAARVATRTERLNELENRVSGIERDMRHLPDKETTHRLEMSLERLAGKLDTMDARMQPVTATVSRLQDYLVEMKESA